LKGKRYIDVVAIRGKVGQAEGHRGGRKSRTWEEEMRITWLEKDRKDVMVELVTAQGETSLDQNGLEGRGKGSDDEACFTGATNVKSAPKEKRKKTL